MTDTSTPSTVFDPTELLASLQHLPGVYRHIGVNDEVLYVGKAKDLKKRVTSYFQKNLSHSPRIALMVQKIVRVDVTITRTETEALLLENNLIRRNSTVDRIVVLRTCQLITRGGVGYVKL